MATPHPPPPVAPPPATLDALVRAQLRALSALRAFVDALRDIKTPERVDAAVRQAIRAEGFASADEWAVDAGEGDADLARFTSGIQALITRLSNSMRCIDELEQHGKQLGRSAKRRDSERPPAPAGLLSLRDYSVLQAAMEVYFCWSVVRRVEQGIVLPIERRRPTKTLDISRHVLEWGIDVSPSRVVVDVEALGRHVSTVAQSMLQLLLLPQIQPILLPKYSVEVVALLVYGETNEEFTPVTKHQCQQMLVSLVRTMPLRLSMASIRGALGQSGGRSSAVLAFKKRCGELLAQLVMEDGGVQTTIEMLLGAVEEGNTQARIQVATLISQSPATVQPSVYAEALAHQVCALFDGSNRQNKLLRETGAVIVSEMATRFPTTFDAQFIAPMFKPLLVYEDIQDNKLRATGGATESELAECVALLHLLLCGPPPSKALVLAFVPMFRPLVHLFGFATSSKSFLGPPLQDTLVAYIKAVPKAALLLQVAVLPVVPALRPTLLKCGLREPAVARSSSLVQWSPLYEFHPGGTGGVAMRIRRVVLGADSKDDPSTPLRLALVGMVHILSLKELESSSVVGELFSSLLLTYMRVRKSVDEDAHELDTGQKTTQELAAYEALRIPRDSIGLEMTLSLLLAIIESLGPSVLRSAEVVLQCLTTVLGMFARDSIALVDSQDAERNRAVEEVEDDDDDDEILTVCLGVLITILEAGASKRREREEGELRAMLPVLEMLSEYPRPQISDLATSARASILSRGAVEKGHAKNDRSGTQKSFEQTLRDAAEDLKSALVPLRARGVVKLTKLVRASQPHRSNAEWTPRIEQLSKVFISHLDDYESYVYLAAVQGLAALSDAHPDVAIPLLTENLRDKSNSLEVRIKLSEALLFSAKRCGETLPKYAKVFVYSYLECIRPHARPPASRAKKPFSLIEEIESSESKTDCAAEAEEERETRIQAANAALAEATLRASCLSNLAEVSAMLKWSLVPFAGDVLSCAYGILQLELDMTSNGVVAIRRGAVFLLKHVLQLMGNKVIEVLPYQLKPMYHTLKHVERVDTDSVVRAHAQHALQAMDDIMRNELFSQEESDNAVSGLRSLRIVKH